MNNSDRSNHGSGPECQDRRIAHQARQIQRREHRKKLAAIRAEARKRAQETEARLSQES